MSTAGQNLSSFNPDEVPSASTFRFAIVTAEWNKEVTAALLAGAMKTLTDCGALQENIHSVSVPGSFELIAGASMLASSGKFDGIICLGCIIQGETRHFEFISQAVAQGLSDVSIKYNMPVIFGVLTTDNVTQSKERAGGRHGNKGIEAAITAIKMADLRSKLGLGG